MTENSKVTFKIGRLVIIIATIIGLVSVAVLGYADIQNKVNHNTEQVKKYDNDLEILKRDVTTILNDVDWIKKELGGN